MRLRAVWIYGLVLLPAAATFACDGEDQAAETRPRSEAAAHRPAPPFALDTLEGDSLTLAALEREHRAILMNFWASWCIPCKEEVPELIELQKEYGDEGFTVLGVTVNDLPRDSRAFVEEIGMTYPSVIGTPAMLEAWSIAPWLPTTLLVADGRIVGEWVGPQTREELEYPIKVALGLAPPVEAMLEDAAADR